MNCQTFIKHANVSYASIAFCLVCLIGSIGSADENKVFRVGIIGLDTSHATAFTKTLNDATDEEMRNCRVVAAYPYGSRDIESSASRIPKYTAEVKAMGVAVVDSIEALLDKVDGVLLETNDGNLHLAQALAVFQAGKPVFIDKPTAARLGEVIAIYRAAERFKVPMFSSSSLRYSNGPQAIRGGKVGDVLGCSTYSPCSLEGTHVDLYWYGIHGVEMLFTCMRTGCKSVSHTSSSDFELAVGHWEDGRIGTFRGIRKGAAGYGGTVFGADAIEAVGKYDGYKPLVREIAKFFRSQEAPIDTKETIEIYAFMQAAFESKNRDGARVTIAEVMAVAEKEADALLADMPE